MKFILSFIQNNKRSLFYAFVMGLGILLGMQLLKEYGSRAFFITIGFTSVVLFLEIYIDWRFATKILSQLDMPVVHIYNLWGHLLNHILLPILLLWTVSGFIYFNSDDLGRFLALGIFITVIVILFINVRSYYQDEFKVEGRTRFIYDVIKLIIFFFGVNLLMHLQSLWMLDVWLTALFVSLLSLILGLLLIYRKGQIEISTIIFIIATSFIVAIIFMVIQTFGVVVLGVNVITFLFFYFSFSVLHHKLERTLTLEVFSQYILIFILAFVIFLGLS